MPMAGLPIAGSLARAATRAADSLMCQLTERYVRFRPARDPQGRPVAQDIGWSPDWSPNR